MRMRVLLTLALIAVVCAPVAQAASTPAQKCAVAKLKAATHKAAVELKCHKKALATGRAVDPACLEKAQTKFAQAFANAEAKGGCKSEDDAAAVQESVEAFVDDVVTTVGPPKSLAADVQPIFDANCTSCHWGPFAPRNLGLASGVAFMDTVSIASMGIPEVVCVLPGDPDNSDPFWKITDTPGHHG